MLEEVELPMKSTINIAKGDQLKPEYLAINPNNKSPRSSIPMDPAASR